MGIQFICDQTAHGWNLTSERDVHRPTPSTATFHPPLPPTTKPQHSHPTPRPGTPPPITTPPNGSEIFFNAAVQFLFSFCIGILINDQELFFYFSIGKENAEAHVRA